MTWPASVSLFSSRACWNLHRHRFISPTGLWTFDSSFRIRSKRVHMQEPQSVNKAARNWAFSCSNAAHRHLSRSKAEAWTRICSLPVGAA